MKALTLVSVFLFSLPCTLILSAGEKTSYIWWEGEDYSRTNAVAPLAEVPGNRSPEQQAKLSGGKWMTPHDAADGGPCRITYEISVPESGTYSFYVRKFWKHGPFKWRFDDGEWNECTKRIALLDSTFLAENWGANWVSLGEVNLSDGDHTFNVEMLENKGCFDCWLLIDGQFSPRGKLKPGEKTGKAEKGYFAWEPDPDPFLEDCPIDMSWLNKPVTGFVERSNNGFVDPDGDEVRFWMVQGSALTAMKKKSVDFWARRLAKYGVNLNRIQLSNMFKAYTAGDMKSFYTQLDDLHYVVAALKKNGIYTYLGHLYWQTHVSVNEKVAGAGYGKGKTPLELLFFDKDFQEYYLGFVNAFMNRKNPYTGLPMSKDPAVAFVEIQNESSLFFWTFRTAGIVPETLELIEREFALWAEKEYGGIENAIEAWGTGNAPSKTSTDKPAEGRLGLYDIALLTGADWAEAQRNNDRASDQLRFMVEWQKDFYEKMVNSFREKLGMQNMISCSNWKTADAKVLGIVERYSYTAGDVICRNVYFGVDYKPRPKRFYSVDIGDTFTGRSALKPPAKPSPLTVAHVLDHPYMITENNWTRPNRFRAEWPFLVAGYARMMGVDGWNFFALDSSVWQTPMKVWELNSPCILGQFPATSLIFRKGYVKEAGYAVTEKIDYEDIYTFKGSRFYELTGQDDLWVSKIGDLEAAADARAVQTEPLAFFVGKINRIPVRDNSGLETVDLKKYIDTESSTVRSMTGELFLDYRKGVTSIDTPFAQGAAGFLSSAKSIKLTDIEIISKNEYGTVLFVSLDGKPLSSSRKILAQAVTEDKPYGFSTQPAGNGYRKITELGGYPLNVKLIDVSVKFKGRSLKSVVLDGNGYRTEREADTEEDADGTRIRLPENSIYTLLYE